MIGARAAEAKMRRLLPSAAPMGNVSLEMYFVALAITWCPRGWCRQVLSSLLVLCLDPAASQEKNLLWKLCPGNMEECYQPVILLLHVVWYTLNLSRALAPHPSQRNHCCGLFADLTLNACSTKIRCRLQGKNKTCSWIRPMLLNIPMEVS